MYIMDPTLFKQQKHIMDTKIIAATGHRPNKLGGYGDDVKNKLINLGAQGLLRNGATHVISGMALGWDQAIAQAAINMGLPFIAAIPCLDQEKLWPTDAQQYYHELLDRASKIVHVTDVPYKAGCIDQRNRWMVDNCDMLLALWNGTLDGTHNCVIYAQAEKKPVANLWEIFKTL